MNELCAKRCPLSAKDKRGAILILTFIIMTTLVVITVAFLYMTSTQLRGSGYDVASAKALWVAEAGSQQVIYQLKNDSGFRDSVGGINNPTRVSGNLGDGSYFVEVYKDGSTYTLTSTGTVGASNRKIMQSVVVVEDGGVTVTPQRDWNEIIPAI